MSFSESEFAWKKKVTRREKFLARMEEIIPWQRLIASSSPFTPRANAAGRPSDSSACCGCISSSKWYALADEALEDAIYDSQSMRAFVRIDLGCEGVPDATTLLKFRHLLERNDLCKSLFSAINADLEARGLILREGTLVDATFIAAPSSTKNAYRKRDPEMHQARKGNEWHFGLKDHIGADRDGRLVHSLVCTAANISDISQTGQIRQPVQRSAFLWKSFRMWLAYTFVSIRAYAMLCFDKKSQFQTRDRVHPGLPMKKGRAGTMIHDYKRNGIITPIFCAGEVDSTFGHCALESEQQPDVHNRGT